MTTGGRNKTVDSENCGRHINIPVFIPHAGCPNTCVFCNQRNISGRSQPQSLNQVRHLIEDWLSTTKPSDDVEIAFFGGSFTGIPRDEMINYLELAGEYVNSGRAKQIRISTRPDYISNEILDILECRHVGVIELGVQSLNEEVLKKSNRGHTVNDVITASRLIKSRGFTLGIQTMPGLPADTFLKAVETARRVIGLQPDIVRIYPAIVLKDTQLEQLYLDEEFKPLTISEAVEWCSELVPLYRDAGIEVVRLGLHYSELLESSVVAGPFHPAFGEMVESMILFRNICREIENNCLINTSGIIIRTWKGAMSKTLGHKKTNIGKLKQKYGYLNIRVEEAALSQGQIQVLTDTCRKEGIK